MFHHENLPCAFARQFLILLWLFGCSSPPSTRPPPTQELFTEADLALIELNDAVTENFRAIQWPNVEVYKGQRVIMVGYGFRVTGYPLEGVEQGQEGRRPGPPRRPVSPRGLGPAADCSEMSGLLRLKTPDISEQEAGGLERPTHVEAPLARLLALPQHPLRDQATPLRRQPDRAA